MEYDGSMMFDEYPDKVMFERIMTYSPFNKKLGVKIRAEGKEWMIEDLYRKDQKVVYKSGNELPTQGGEVKESVKSIYENAEWKLKPSKDVYHIWIDQYIENTEAIIEPVELFRLIDQTSGTEFIVSLTDIDMIMDGWKSQKESGIVE